MRPLFFSLGLLSLAAPLSAQIDFTVHEWGTFTSVVGSDGVMLSGLEREEDHVPGFIHSFAGFAPFNKGWDRPVAGVTVKMETPVLYFYSPQPLTAQVAVKFHGGSISQWYPDRIAGEQMPDAAGANAKPPALVDFSRGHEGSATWRVDVLPHDTQLAINGERSWETPQWPRARIASANRVRGGGKNEIESFIFYRGIGNFSLPLKATCAADGALMLVNSGTDRIPFVWVYDKPRDGGATLSWSGALAGGEKKIVASLSPGEIPFADALVAAGLTREEARALMATWHESYFESPGRRIFWIVPRAFTDAVLPIAITPQPAHLERVLVGRTEILTPQFEQELLRDYVADGAKRWADDRYILAYRERIHALRDSTHDKGARVSATGVR